MGKKKKVTNVPEPKAPSDFFCFYCDRPFDDEGNLVQHQRSRHFRCQECDATAVRGKCESVQGLMIHTLKVHGKSLARVPNAMLGRDRPDLHVYGMDGIPPEVLEEKGMAPQAPAPPPTSSPPSGESSPPLQMTMPSFPGGMPGAPSLVGFQQFLAAQGGPSGSRPPMPSGPGSMSGMPGPGMMGTVPGMGLGGMPHLPMMGSMPSLPTGPTGGAGAAGAAGNPFGGCCGCGGGCCGGAGAGAGGGVKRPLEEASGNNGEDLSVEEKRARLQRYN
eukprot:CAMPEP_0206459828 /NCGR_PEP_ID=MMETSP0324_2-20121206/24402_1 /ASSEMBLY_ACC=CAM_ASM_000836 /TAXON_ID=2866 /ORGANISM="Crypthecodinium cohnii, Strain Seligo" /LENGTH=274 /DNA_ID=CAMNT_0053931441 /DNA_START=69 /DNA_END=893 /DNA_ORIENTATION=-